MDAVEMGKHKFTRKERLFLKQAVLKRCFELLDEKLQKYVDTLDDFDELDQMYLDAYWSLLCRRVLDACIVDPLSLPVTTEDDLNKEVSTIDEYFGLALTPANRCSDSVKNRLEATKRMIGDKFAHEFKDLVNKAGISSPIEQMFLMEWKYADVENRFNVDLEPQAEIHTDAGDYHVDFLVTSKSTGELGTAIVIELDGHDFHERTKEQVERDNKRQRAITKAGMRVLRFSGREIVMKGRKCIQEVIDFIEAT